MVSVNVNLEEKMKQLLKSAVVASLFALGSLQAQAEELIRAQVSAPGATMYVINTHLASVLKERHGYNLEVATGFPGVRSQVNNAKGEADISIYAPPLAFFMKKGIAMYQDMDGREELVSKLSVLSTFSGDMFTFGTYDENLKSLADIEDKRVFLGPKGAALVRINAGLIEAATGLKANEDYELVHVDWAGSPALLQDGSVDVLFQLCAAGCAQWTELSTTRKLKFIGYTEEMMQGEAFAKQMKFPGRLARKIQPGTWGENQVNTEPVNVVGEFTGLLVSDTMSDEVAYNITKAFWETLPDLKAIAPFADEYDIKKATFGAVLPIQAGAMKYLKEQGVE